MQQEKGWLDDLGIDMYCLEMCQKNSANKKVLCLSAYYEELVNHPRKYTRLIDTVLKGHPCRDLRLRDVSMVLVPVNTGRSHRVLFVVQLTVDGDKVRLSGKLLDSREQRRIGFVQSKLRGILNSFASYLPAQENVSS